MFETKKKKAAEGPAKAFEAAQVSKVEPPKIDEVLAKADKAINTLDEQEKKKREFIAQINQNMAQQAKHQKRGDSCTCF